MKTITPNYDAAHAVVSANGGYHIGLLPKMFDAALRDQVPLQFESKFPSNPQLAAVLEAISVDIRDSRRSVHADHVSSRAAAHANTLAALAAALRMPA